MDWLRRLVFQKTFTKRSCAHIDEVIVTEPAEPSCPSCVEVGSDWVHVRMCMTCGHRGCCDTSKLHHARSHHDETGHPLIRSIEPRESWGWCYVDDAYLTEDEYTRHA